MYLHIVTFNCAYGIIDTKPTCASHEGLQRCPPPSSQCPLGRVCFGRLRITPLQRGWNQIPCPRKMSLTSENLVGIKDGCTLIVLFFFEQVKVSESDEVIGGSWIYCSTCTFMMNQQSTHLRFESIYRNH